MRPLRLRLRPIGRPGDDEKKRASPNHENANGCVNVQREPSCEGGDRFIVGQSPSVHIMSILHVFWLGTACTEGLIGCPPGPTAAPAPTATRGAFPTLPGPDIVEPVAAAATVPAVFAEATEFVVLLQNLMQRQNRSKVRTSDYYQGSE